jgi:dienelactone hydrolase
MTRSRALTTTLLLSLLVGCVAPDDALDIDGDHTATAEEASETPEDAPDYLALAPDPATAATHGWCYGNYVWNGTAARIYHPAGANDCSTSVHSPLVVLLKGNGFSHTSYHYLGRHLAKNGYIVVALDVVSASNSAADHQAAANEAWAFVNDYVWTVWPKRFFIDPSRVALVGHSRGGETVRYLAHDLKNNPVFHVKSVIALAPTRTTPISLDAQTSLSAMVLVGTADTDTRAESAYAAHDTAGSDASQQDPNINPSALYRSMKLLTNVTHGSFAGDFVEGATVQGYVLAFLHAHLKNDVTYYEDYVRGDAVPAAWPFGVTSQYSDGFLRRVIDNFDDGALANSTIGGFVSVAIGNTSIVENLGTSSTTPHQTFALRYDPPSSGAGFIWEIPAGKRDASYFKYLSLRVGQAAGAPTDDLRVRIHNAGVTSPWVRLTDHGQLAQPTTMYTFSGVGITSTQQAHMGTIRIPLSAFGSHDDLQWIELGAANEAIRGEYLIDNLEFSEFVLKP